MRKADWLRRGLTSCLTYGLVTAASAGSVILLTDRDVNVFNANGEFAYETLRYESALAQAPAISPDAGDAFSDVANELIGIIKGGNTMNLELNSEAFQFLG